jgi:hypothetical protein
MIKSIGTDPEFFLEKDSVIISSLGLIPGTKDYPHRVSNHVLVHPDNISLELSIPPANDKTDFVQKIHLAVNSAKEYLATIDPKINLNSDLSSIFASKELLDDPLAKTLGCSVDFNAFYRKQNKRPNGKSTNLRTCGGHIHVGLPDEYVTNDFIEKCVLMMDLYLGIPSIILDKDKARRALYGKPSAFRFKPYGFEYRVLSNFWLKNENLINWVYDNTALAVEQAKKIEGNIEDYEIYSFIARAIDIINSQNEEMAATFIQTLNIPLPKN